MHRIIRILISIFWMPLSSVYNAIVRRLMARRRYRRLESAAVLVGHMREDLERKRPAPTRAGLNAQLVVLHRLINWQPDIEYAVISLNSALSDYPPEGHPEEFSAALAAVDRLFQAERIAMVADAPWLGPLDVIRPASAANKDKDDGEGDGSKVARDKRKGSKAAARSAQTAGKNDPQPPAALPTESALLGALTEKFLGSWAFKIAIAMLLMAASFSIV